MGFEVMSAVVAAVGAKKTGFRISPFTNTEGTKTDKANLEDTFLYVTRELKTRDPELAYLHVIEPRSNGDIDVTPGEGENIDFIAKLWAPKVLLVAGGHKEEDAERVARDYQNAVAVYGRHFISNVS